MILIRKKFQVVFFSMFLSLISSGCIRYESGSARGLLLWNKLGSRREVLNSQVGPGGQVNAGRFVEGRFGRGVELNMQEAFGVTFPLDAVPTSAGCIEFWAKLVDFPQSLPWFKDPGLIGLGDENTDPLLRFNLNDGISDGGLCVRLPGIGSAGTGLFGAWTYARALGTTAENVADWHHYALVWNPSGIPGILDGTARIAAFVDGKLNTGLWNGIINPPGSLVLPAEGRLGLLWKPRDMPEGSIVFDNLKVWNYAKIDFEDRFDEGGGRYRGHQEGVRVPENMK
jgi:hypothetical protein